MLGRPGRWQRRRKPMPPKRLAHSQSSPTAGPDGRSAVLEQTQARHKLPTTAGFGYFFCLVGTPQYCRYNWFHFSGSGYTLPHTRTLLSTCQGVGGQSPEVYPTYPVTVRRWNPSYLPSKIPESSSELPGRLGWKARRTCRGGVVTRRGPGWLRRETQEH